MREHQSEMICKRCDWWWVRVIRHRHWWSRTEIRWLGPYWPGGGAARWYPHERFLDDYPDCVPHLVPRLPSGPSGPVS
jgi:hypothetical protein